MRWLPFVSEGWSLVVSGVRVGGRGDDLLTLETGPRLLLNRIERDPNLSTETPYVGPGLAGNGRRRRAGCIGPANSCSRSASRA